MYNLAAEHRDDVSPKSLYDEVNVDGARNLCGACDTLGVRRIIFTSSVAVYGFCKAGSDETTPFNPFNDYGRTKMEAEGIYRDWLGQDPGRSLAIIRPTVIFGERNRGNVYNLIKQISSGLFMMVGNGKNVKSMAYVENIAAFLQHALEFEQGEHLYNYVDGPDFDMNSLVSLVNGIVKGRMGVGPRLPYWMGYFGGLCMDAMAALIRKKLPISAIRVKKFCATTQFAAEKLKETGFKPQLPLREGLERTIRYEFVEDNYSRDSSVFSSE